MNFAPATRPSGCLKALLRQARYQRQQLQLQLGRAQSTHAKALKPADIIRDSDISGLYTYKRNRCTFAVHPPVPTIRDTFPDPLPGFEKAEIARLDPTGARTALFSRYKLDAARPGDILLVTHRHSEPFAGALMQIRRRGPDTAIQLRGKALGTGVEMWFKVYSQEVVGIDIVWRRPKRARRARLTYLRKPEHDMGDVTPYVMAWRSEMRQLRSKEKIRAAGGRKTKKK